MRKILSGALLWALLCAVPSPTMARAFINVSIGLPPPIVFAAPPELVVLPGSNVYVAPDLAEDIFFYSGWWWRPWGGHWYRSRSYDSGWAYYRNVPSFYRGIPSSWRNDYRDHRWHGRQWDHQRISHQQLHQNWRSWEQNRHWERQNGSAPGIRSQQQSLHPSRNTQLQQNRSQLQGQRSRSPQSSQMQTQQHQSQGGVGNRSGRTRQQHGRTQDGQEEQHQRR